MSILLGIMDFLSSTCWIWCIVAGISVVCKFAHPVIAAIIAIAGKFL